MKSACVSMSLLLIGMAITSTAQTTNKTLSDTVFNQIVNKQFRALLSDATVSTGAFASLDLKEPDVTFSPSFILKNGNIVSAKASGGVSDGFFELFNNSELNPSVSVGVDYHFLWKDSDKKARHGFIEYMSSEKTKLLEKARDVKSTYTIDSLRIVMRGEQVLLILETDKLNAKHAKDSVMLHKLDSVISAAAPRNPGLLPIRSDSLRFVMVSDSLKVANNQAKISEWNTLRYVGMRNNQLDTKRKEDLEAVDLTKLKLVGFQFGWFTLGAQVTHDAFKLFDPDLALDKQVVDTSFTSFQFRVQYSFYRWSKKHFRSVYFTLGAKYNHKSNFQDLKKTEVLETTNHGSGSFERTTAKKYNTYKGIYRPSLHGLELNSDLYYFMFNNNTVALHLYQSAEFQDGEFPKFSTGCGLVFPFTTKDKDKPILNAEVYYTVRDLANAKREGNDIFDRNNIGIRFTYPIDFNPK